MTKDNFGNLLSKLLKQRGFRLEKISPTTFPPDIITTHRRKGGYTKKELGGILELVRSGTAYRCRIGKSRYFYGETPSDAIRLALRNG